MKQIIATENIFNEYGYLIAVKYYYEDLTTREVKKFIPNYLQKLDIAKPLKTSHSKPNKT